MAVRCWALAFVLVLVGGVGCSDSPSGQPPAASETQIVLFEVSPDRVEPGGVVTVSWRAEDVGRVGGVPYCTLQWTVRDRDPEPLLEVACEGSLEVEVPEEETVVQFQFSALKHDRSTYVTRSRTVTVELESAGMVLEVDTNLIAGTTVTLPLRGSVDVSVDWGDGSSSTATSSGNLQHTYASNRSYTISISGSLEQFGAGLDGYPHADAIVGVSAWGDPGLTSLSGAFRNASNLASVPTSLPNTVTSTSGMFWGASTFNQPLDTWNTSNVTDKSGMFGFASAFNQPLGTWNTSNVTTMSDMFVSASAFNQPLDSWDTSNVTTMSWMFENASAFNQPLNTWNTSNVTEMQRMFYGASAFNQPLDNWNTSNVTNMADMFFRASSFNRDLSGWCVVNIPDRPEHFDDGATSWTLPRPVWGTCPGGEVGPPVEDDVRAPIEGFVVPPSEVSLVTAVSGAIHDYSGGQTSMSLFSPFGGAVVDVMVDGSGRFDALLPSEPEIEWPLEPILLCGEEVAMITLQLLAQHDGPFGPDLAVEALYAPARPVTLAVSDTPDEDTTMLYVAYAFSEGERDCAEVVDDERWDPPHRYDHDVRLRPGWNTLFAVTGETGGAFVNVLRTGDPGESVPWIEFDLEPP